MGKPAIMLAAAAALMLGMPSAAPAQTSAKTSAKKAPVKRAPVKRRAPVRRPAAAVPAQQISCADGTISRSPASSMPCRGHGGIFAASATKVMSTAPDDVTATTLATKLPTGSANRTIATTANRGDSRAVTEVTQITTPGSAPTSLRPTRTEITVRCYDNSVIKVASVKGACKRRGGVASSVTTATMRVPAGASKAIAARTPTGVAVVATENAPGQASATRVTQTSVYAPPPPKPHR